MSGKFEWVSVSAKPAKMAMAETETTTSAANPPIKRTGQTAHAGHLGGCVVAEALVRGPAGSVVAIVSESKSNYRNATPRRGVLQFVTILSKPVPGAVATHDNLAQRCNKNWPRVISATPSELCFLFFLCVAMTLLLAFK